MSTHTPLGLYMGLSIAFMLGLIYLILWRRFKTFTTRDFVLRYRNGILVNQDIGGGYFLIPIIDTLVVLSRGIQRIDFIAKQPIIFKPKFEVEEFDKKIDEIEIIGFITYEIVNPTDFYEQSNSLTEGEIGSEFDDDLIISTNKLLKDIVESHLQAVVLSKPLDRLYRNRDLVKQSIGEVVNPYEKKLGIEFKEIRVSKFSLN